MKHYTITENGKAINFKAYNAERAARKAERLARENKMHGYELNRRTF